MKTLLRDLAPFALVTLALLFGYVKVFGADKDGSAAGTAARVKVALALTASAERERAPSTVSSDAISRPGAKTCPCSEQCTCGCNDGLPCRCGPAVPVGWSTTPQVYPSTPTSAPYVVLQSGGVPRVSSASWVPRQTFPGSTGGWRRSAGSCGPGG